MKGFITVVSGLPRSMTSAGMRMLEFGGMKVLKNEDEIPTDMFNPWGYYEDPRSWRADLSWLERYGNYAVKIPIPYVENLPQIEARVLLMLRRLDRTLYSIRKVGLDLLDPTYYPSLNELTLMKLLGSSASFLVERGIPTMVVIAEKLISDPSTYAKEVCEFLGLNLNQRRMVQAIERKRL